MQSYQTKTIYQRKFNESSFKEIKTGEPQGSIPCPLLVRIYINDLAHMYTILKVIMYTYDTTT